MNLIVSTNRIYLRFTERLARADSVVSLVFESKMTGAEGNSVGPTSVGRGQSTTVGRRNLEKADDPLNVEPSQPNKTPASIEPLPRRLRRWLFTGAIWCGLALLTVWGVAALYFDVRVAWLRAPLAAVYALAALAVWIRVKRPWLSRGLIAGGFALVLAWWLALQPSNERDWQPDLAVLSYADIVGSQVTLHNIRNCDYRTETDFDVRHYDKTFNLDKIESADLYMVYWGSPSMAHTMVSFGFEGGDYVCFSIETRKEKGEGYSAIKGLFRQFELIYVVADERDLVRLRTNYRQGEDAYLYRLRGSPERLRAFFLDYVRRVNDLRQRPEWYNAVTHNCTTGIRTQRAATDRAPWDWRMLVNGYGDELLYEHGAIATNLPFAEFKRRSLINPQAKSADKDLDFSRRIRQDLPGANP